MADTIADYSLQFQVSGSKATVKAMEDIIKKMEEINKQNNLNIKTINNDNKAIKEQTEQFKKQEKQIGKTSSALWTYTKRLLTIGAVIGLVRKAWNMGVGFAQEGQNIKFQAASSNMSAREYQKWAHVAKRYGGNEGSVANAMQNIDMQIENAKYGEVPLQEVAARYGVTLPSGGNAEDFLKIIAKKMESMDRRSQLAMGRAFGFDEATIRMLQLGLKGLTDELAKAESKVAFDNAQLEKADALNKKLVDIRQEFHKLSVALGGEMADSIVFLSKQIVLFGNEVVKAAHKWFSEGVGEDVGKFIAEDKGKRTWGEYLVDKAAEGIPMLYGTPLKWAAKVGLGILESERTGRIGALKKMWDMESGIASSILNSGSMYLSDIAGGIVNQDINIEVNGAQSPEQTAETIVKSEAQLANEGLIAAGLGFANVDKG